LQKPSPQNEPYWPYLYPLILLPCLIYTLFYTARAIRLDYTPVPFWDSWRSVQYVDRLLRFDLRHFWVQHNEHRIVFPEMVYALDYIFFRGEQLLPIACNIACQLAQLALLWWLLRRMKDMPLAFRLTLGVGCSLFMTSAMQVQGILGTFELQWYLSQLAAALSFLLLWRSARTGRWASLAMSLGAAVIVTYSTSNGMALWPVLAMMAVLLRLSRPRIAIVAIAGVLSIAAYFVGYSFMGQGRTAILLAHPFYAIWFMCVLLGTPVSYASARLGGLAGLSGLLLVALAAALAFRQRRSRGPVLVVTAGVCLYIAGSALMIAYGRMEPGDPAAGAALPARYVSVPLTYCANLAVAIGWLIMRLPRGRPLALHLSAAALTLLILVAVMRPQRSYEKAFAAQQAMGHATGIALVAGVDDPDLIRVIFPDPAFVRAMSPAIRQRRLSIFASGRQDWIGQPVDRLFRIGPPDLCSGSVDELAAIDSGYRAEGWALDRATDRPPKNVVLTNPSGIIVGLAETRSGGYPRRAVDHTRRPPSDLDWAGFARADRMSGKIQAYAIVSGGKTACDFGAARQVSQARTVDAGRVGAAIHISEWKADPAWTLKGFHPSVGTLAGEVLYGSYSGSDANQGALTSAPFEPNGRDCIALPVAHGPSSGGQSVRLVEDGSGKTVAAIPLGESSGLWQYWSIDLQGTDKLRIVAEDRGGQWGQWVAVGEPHWCKP
jgi:hypothetical protein